MLVPDRPNFFELSKITDIRTYIFYATVIQFKKTFCYIKEYHINYHFTERYLENIIVLFIYLSVYLIKYNVASLLIRKTTARRWMHKMGFRYKQYHKGLYIDGHERTNVVGKMAE